MSSDGDLRIALEEPETKRRNKDLPEGKIKYDEDEPNLVETFQKSEVGRAWLKRICKRVLEDFDQDWESTKEYRERQAQDFKLFAGTLPAKDFPFEHCANTIV